MASRLRALQRRWNDLVPQANAQGLRGIRLLNIGNLREPIAYREQRLEWLRRELNLTSALSTPAVITAPNSAAFTFGVELELIMPVEMTHANLAEKIQAAGIPCRHEMYNHSVRQSWKVVTDGSLGDYSRGAEVVSPILTGEAGFEALRQVCNVLTAIGCTINKHCGFHVHVGARGENLDFFKNLVKLYAAAEPAIDTFVAPSRRGPVAGNGYCKSLQIRRSMANATTIEAVAACIGQTTRRDDTRYCKLNLTSYWQHGTVEFRQHQGTVEAEKAENWVRFCLRMAMAARNGASPANTIEALLTTIGASETETQYITRRVAHFNQLINRS